MPTVSVVIPAKNAALTIERAILSALNQSYPPLEVIVVDDGSSDSTRQLVSNFGSLVQLIYGANQGAGPARNLAILAAKADYVAFLDADDFWHHEKLEHQVPTLRPRVISATYAEYLSPQGGRPIGHSVATKDDYAANRYILEGRGVPAILSSWIVNRNTLIEAGMFNPEFRYAQDYDLLLRLASLECKIQIVRMSLVGYLVHNQSSSATAHRLQFLTAEYLRAKHLKGVDMDFTAWSTLRRKNLNFKRKALAGYLFRKAIATELNSRITPIGIIYLATSAVLDPSRFLHKVITQSKVSRGPR
jgi:glycosyltransferase involved in cell wall biosynthesis